MIDHHQVPSGESAAFALINPHRPDDRFPFKGLASCGVAFYLAGALRTRLAVDAARFDPRDLLDLVALGTVADLVPLVDENRILVAAGLRIASARKRPGLRALAALAGIEPEEPITAEHVSFRLAPRLNAAGRLGEAQLALDLLLAPDDATADRLAAELDECNRQRQMIQEQVWTRGAERLRAARDRRRARGRRRGLAPGRGRHRRRQARREVRAPGDRDRLRSGAGARARRAPCRGSISTTRSRRARRTSRATAATPPPRA